MKLSDYSDEKTGRTPREKEPFEDLEDFFHFSPFVCVVTVIGIATLFWLFFLRPIWIRGTSQTVETAQLQDDLAVPVEAVQPPGDDIAEAMLLCDGSVTPIWFAAGMEGFVRCDVEEIDTESSSIVFSASFYATAEDLEANRPIDRSDFRYKMQFPPK